MTNEDRMIRSERDGGTSGQVHTEGHQVLYRSGTRQLEGVLDGEQGVLRAEVKEPMAALVESLPEQFGPFKIFR